MSSNRHYGLQLTKKNSHVVQKHAAFGDDSDSEKSDGENTDWAKKAFKANEKNTVKRQTKIEMLRALDDDSTVYQYDEIYDQIQKGKQDSKLKDKERKPKYIQKLMVAAEKRKIENERRIERQVQKEREAEGEEFKDKETFVTAAYKKKLEEFAKLDEEQKRYDMLEEIGDVTKQQDMGGFYRHLYQTTVNVPSDDSPTKLSVKEENESSKKDGTSIRRSQSKGGSASKETSPSKFSKDVKQVRNSKESENSSDKIDNKKDSRQYRKRKYSESPTNKNNRDADTGGSSSSSSSSSDSESGEEKSSQSETEDPKRIRSKGDQSSNAQPIPAENIIEVEPAASSFPLEPERSIWEKRTVGPVFEAALKRYLERKCARLALIS